MSATPPEPVSGAEAHFRRLEALYRSAPINRGFSSDLTIVGPGRAEIVFAVEEAMIAEARILDAEGEECGRGTGTFARSHIALSGLAGYTAGK